MKQGMVSWEDMWSARCTGTDWVLSTTQLHTVQCQECATLTHWSWAELGGWPGPVVTWHRPGHRWSAASRQPPWPRWYRHHQLPAAAPPRAPPGIADGLSHELEPRWALPGPSRQPPPSRGPATTFTVRAAPRLAPATSGRHTGRGLRQLHSNCHLPHPLTPADLAPPSSAG